jgi:hypothetical protein
VPDNVDGPRLEAVAVVQLETVSEKDVVVIVVIERFVNMLGWQYYMDMEKNKDLQMAPDKRSSCIVRH